MQLILLWKFWKQLVLAPPFFLSFFHPHKVWPDLAKFRHFGRMLKHFGHFESVHLVFGKILSLFWQICNANGQIFIVVNSQILKIIKSSGHTALTTTTFTSFLIRKAHFDPYRCSPFDETAETNPFWNEAWNFVIKCSILWFLWIVV